MVSRLLGLPDSLVVSWLVLTGSGLLIYFTLSGISYLIVYVIGRRRFHPSYVADRSMNRRAMRLSAVGLAGNILLTMPLHALLGAGRGRIYWAVSARGVGWLVASVVLYVVFVDTAIYWSHRVLHGDLLFRHVHRFHHAWRVPNSWTSMAFHPVDSFLFALPVHLFALLVPLHGYVYLAMQTGMSLWSVASHDRVALVRWRWLNYVDNHTLHHWLYRCNYGQFFTIWDRLMGTWRDPVGEVAAGSVPVEVLR